jgi:FlaG/FlaF family flagellin (archaellin)
MNGSETDFTEGRGADGNSFVRWLDVSAGETYFIVIDRPIGNSPFNLEWTGTATFAEPPNDESTSSGTPLDFEKCDNIMPFDDGLVDFDLIDNTIPIVGSQTDVTVTYHTSASDANIGINSLTSPYRNTTNPQTIYARITNTITGCFELTDFQLNVNLGPNFTIPSDFILCDNLDDGDERNGRVVFDLSSKNSEILAGEDLSDFNVLYYASRTNAENRTGALPNSYYNNTAFNETLFVRIEDATNQNCRSFTELNLRVNEAPDSFNSILIQCDEDGLADGLTTFNLNEANNELTGGITNRSTRFYTDLARTIEVSGDSFDNTTNPQIIFVEVINDDTGCISNSELTLDVTATDSNNAFLISCDDDGVEDGDENEFVGNDIAERLTPGLREKLSSSLESPDEGIILPRYDPPTGYRDGRAHIKAYR